jgi:hypothetical protein
MANQSTQKATTQRVFDRVVQEGFRQGKPAVNRSGGCVYVNQEGERCAIGHLLSASELAHLRRGKRLNSTVSEWAKRFADRVTKRLGVDVAFLKAVQEAHDLAVYEDLSTGWADEPLLALKEQWLGVWSVRMAEVAVGYGLDTKVLSKELPRLSKSAQRNVTFIAGWRG